MSDKRTNVSVKSDHIKVNAHLVELVRLGEHDQAVKYISEHQTDFSNMGGALDKADREQWPGDYGGGPVDPTDPPGVLGRFDAAPSDWAAWRFITDAERTAMEARYPSQQVQIVNLVQFYAGGSAGGIAVNGKRNPDGSYWFWKLTPEGETLTPDTGGAADIYVNQLCDNQGRPRPGHLR